MTTNVEHDPTIPTPPKLSPSDRVMNFSPGIKALEDGLEHGGKFYFLRAFWTTMGILLSWTAWVLIPIAVITVVILLAGGLGAVMPDDDPIGEPGSDFSLACDPSTEQC